MGWGWGGMQRFMYTLMMGWGGMLTFMYILGCWCYIDDGVGWGRFGMLTLQTKGHRRLSFPLLKTGAKGMVWRRTNMRGNNSQKLAAMHMSRFYSFFRASGSCVLGVGSTALSTPSQGLDVGFSHGIVGKPCDIERRSETKNERLMLEICWKLYEQRQAEFLVERPSISWVHQVSRHIHSFCSEIQFQPSQHLVPRLSECQLESRDPLTQVHLKGSSSAMRTCHMVCTHIAHHCKMVFGLLRTCHWGCHH